MKQESDVQRIQRLFRLKMSIDEKLAFFARMSATLNAGQGPQDFLHEEQKVFQLMETLQPSRKAFLLSGKPNSGGREFIDEMCTLVIDQGLSFPKAALNFPGIFDNYLVSILNAADKTGNYAAVLSRYTTNLRKIKELRDTLIAAMIYPALVLIAATVVIVLFMIIIVPGFVTIYQGLIPGEDFPWSTKLIITLSNFFVNNWLVMAVCFIVGGLSYGWARTQIAQIKTWEDKVLLHIPLVSNLIAQVDVVNFLNTYVLLINSGVSLSESILMAVESLKNREIYSAARTGAEHFSNGLVSTIREALARQHPIFSEASSFYPEMQTYEQTANVDILQKYADLIEYNAMQTRDRIVKMIEPISIIVLGGLVGFLVFALYMPLFELIGKLAR